MKPGPALDPDTHTLVGAIAGAFGVKGEVRIKSFCANPADLERYSPLINDSGLSFTISGFRAIKDGFAARFKEIATKEAADALRGCTLYAQRAHFPELTEDEFYHADLIGMKVLDGDGQTIGRVVAVQNFGAGDILELATSGKTVLVPFTRAIVPTVDIGAKTIIIDRPEGLFDDG